MSGPPPRVVGVIVHHRGRAMLQRAIVSLLESTAVTLEVVVVSNRCLEPLPEVVDSSPRVHVVVSEESLGFSAANNLGVRWARDHLAPAGWYYFVNNDTQSTPGALAEMIRQLDEWPSAVLAGPRLLILGAPGHLNSLGIRLTVDGWGWDEGIGQRQRDHGPLPATRPVPAVTGSALLMRAEAFEQVGRWTELYDYYFEDIDLCLKAWKAGYEVLQVPSAVVLHQISASMGVASKRKLDLFWRNRLFLALVHWPADLLARLAWRVVVREVLLRRWRDGVRQRRALVGTLRHLGGLLRARFERRGEMSWRHFLVPAGSVPVITLPEVAPLDRALPLPTRGVDRDNQDDGSMDSVSENDEQDIGLEEDAPELPARPGDDGDEGGAAILRRASAWIPRSESGRRLLVVGWCPLPFDEARMNYAPGTRSWQLARALAEDGHAVCLAVAWIPGAQAGEQPGLDMEERDGVLIVRFERRRFETPGELERLVDDFRPDALVAAAVQPARRAVEVTGELPLWIDVFGDPMAEAQAKALVDPQGRHLAPYYRLLAGLLARGDAFSAVSDRQRWALLGQLALAGRLARSTAGEELVATIPVSCEPWVEDGEEREPPAIDGWRPTAEDVLILWSGGYNTWCDVETLAGALERLLGERRNVHFVSTGGAIEGHDESTYDELRRRLAASPHAERCHLAGRLPSSAAMAWQRRADVAVVTERRLAERQLGSSGRVQRWLVEGVPLVCAELSELGELVARRGFGRTYAVGDAESLARALRAAVDDPVQSRERAMAGRRWALRELGPAATTDALRRWARSPRRAADAVEGSHEKVPTAFERIDFELRCRLAETRDDLVATRRQLRGAEEGFHRIRSELGRIHQSRMWKTWMALTAPLTLLRKLLGRDG